MSDIITDPDKWRAGWSGGGSETKCGQGSTLSKTVFQRKWIPEVIAKHGITDIADIGAGDLNWAKRTKFGCKYSAYDLVPRHPDVRQFNVLTDPLPESDCYMLMWVLHHFPPHDQAATMLKLLDTNARFVLMTWQESMETCTNLPYIEKAVLRKTAAHNLDLEIRLCKL